MHSSPSEPPDDLVDALVQSAFATMAVLTRVAAAHELSLTQLRVLGILRDRQVRMSELADHLGLEKSTLTGLVARAQARGLLARVPDPTDGRAVAVRLTAAGHELAGRVAAGVAAELAPRTVGLTATEQRRLAGALHRTISDPAFRR